MKIVDVFFLLLLLSGTAHLLVGCGYSDSSDTVSSSQREGASAKVEQETPEIRIKTTSGEHVLSIELAVTAQEQAKGLMFRSEMPSDHGMLFIYHEERPINMWMKNTILSLDMLFLQRDGTISKIEKRTEPFSERIIPSGGPVYGVLELIAGTADRLQLKIGDRVLHPLLIVNDR